jgi:hypothetical protein
MKQRGSPMTHDSTPHKFVAAHPGQEEYAWQ